LVFLAYTLTGDDLTFEYILQLIVVVLIGYLLWRVETLSDLSISLTLEGDEESPMTEGPDANNDLGSLLQQRCIDTQLYLQHDLTLSQLAKTVGTNRTYLSQYFSSQGTTYNAYINNLRIQHFISLYRESLASQQSVSAKQLAHDSGYRSYSTFALAFKQRTGQSVMAWMQEMQGN
jgi:AraC-like DNA-binding protein